MQVSDRFIRYAMLDTGSSETTHTHPSTDKQWALARLLQQELLDLGAQNVRLSPECYVYGEFPANVDGQPAIGLIAHMDTSPAVATGPVQPRRVRYEGGDLPLGHGVTMRAADFESLASHIGQELIVTDGATLLGGDDKAGIAEIMTACEMLVADPSIPHGKICVGFTPDEEIGEGADHFDVPGFGADFAYTVDGSAAGELEMENFNGCSATVTVHGFSIHTGSAKNKMRNAASMAAEFATLLPESETPEHTELREGFFHLCDLSGDVTLATLRYIIRDHDKTLFERRKEKILAAGAWLNAKYGEGTVEVTLRDSYFNMKEKIEGHPEIVTRAQDALRAVGDEPVMVAIRGGTDGARLSYMGLPCPNLPTGDYNAHGVMEYVSVPEMERITRMLVELVRAR